MVLGVVGSALGLLLGTAAAWLALHWLAGDLGGGYFPGIAPSLQFSVPAALAFAVLGVLAALMGGWAPALQAQRLAAAQALKGLGGTHERAIPGWAGPALVGVGAALSFAPAWQGMALGAYVAVAFLLLGGIACVPTLVDWLLRRARPQDHALAVLAVGRARHERQAATVAVAGVVASLSLAVALTIMVASFRSGVALWLEQVLPADLYARTATSTAASDGAFLPPEFVEAAATLPGVSRVDAARVRSVVLDPSKPAISLVARPLSEQALQGRRVSQVLPMVAPSSPPVSTVDNTHAALDGYVTEAMEMLYGARPGTLLELPVATIGGSGSTLIRIRVKGVWRDYARQFGAVAIDLREYQALTGDTRINDLAISLDDGADVGEVQRQLREKVPQPALIEFAVPAQIRAISMRIFDRSFAVTYYLQALAIGIGLFGIAASFSAQVLARRKEFGLLSHLGLTRWQIVSIVAGEGAAWTAAGALAGLVLGLAVSAVLVHVVNPQSFHWTMQLVVPWDRLGLLCAAVLLAGSLTAALSARTAASADAVRSVKEDW
jgi:putative ABC transport system permease protein